MIKSQMLMVKATFLFPVALLIASCAPTVPPASPALSPSVDVPSADTIQIVPTETPKFNLTSVAPDATAITAFPLSGLAFSDPSIGISFNYPPDWQILPRAPDDPPGMTLHAPAVGEGPEPIIFAITIVIDPVSETSVGEIVDQQLQQVPANQSVGIKRKAVRVGGEDGVEVIGLPSLQGAIETFVLHRGQLYLVILQPYDETNESLKPYLAKVRTVYGSVLSSWNFLK